MIRTILELVGGLFPRPATPVFGKLSALKVCARCESLRPVRAFSRHAGRRDGLQPYCKTCQTIVQRERRALLRARKLAAESQIGRTINIPHIASLAPRTAPHE